MELKEKNYQAYIDQFRAKNIPDRYNQVQLLDELNNPEIDHFISISSRTDGKSINYIHALLDIAVKFDLGILFLTRNWKLRISYQTLLDEIFNISDIYSAGDFTFIRGQEYITMNHNKQKRSVALITDLNSATDLKYYSNLLKNFPIIVYDEFLAIESDYLSDEWVKLKTIYESIDRIETYPLINKPKIFYLGNAVNFDSPILHGLKIFNILENHPINTMKIYKYAFNIALEINRNENTNKLRNTRAFGSDDDSMSTGQFEVNDYNIATKADRYQVKKNPRTIYVKLRDNYLKIWFNRDTLDIILSIESFIKEDEKYQYCLVLKDKKSDVRYLDETYFDERQLKKFDKGVYLFDNNFSKNFITTNFGGLNTLKLNKIIREFLKTETPETELIEKEKQFTENYIEETKKGLFKRLWGN